MEKLKETNNLIFYLFKYEKEYEISCFCKKNKYCIDLAHLKNKNIKKINNFINFNIELEKKNFLITKNGKITKFKVYSKIFSHYILIDSELDKRVSHTGDSTSERKSYEFEDIQKQKDDYILHISYNFVKKYNLVFKESFVKTDKNSIEILILRK